MALTHLEYQGYRAHMSFDEHAACYRGRVENIADLIRFEGLSPQQAQHAFYDCVDVYLSVCQKREVLPSRSYVRSNSTSSSD